MTRICKISWTNQKENRNRNKNKINNNNNNNKKEALHNWDLNNYWIWLRPMIRSR